MEPPGKDLPRIDPMISSDDWWEEIARRDAELDADPSAGLSWEQIRRDIEARL